MQIGITKLLGKKAAGLKVRISGAFLAKGIEGEHILLGEQRGGGFEATLASY